MLKTHLQPKTLITLMKDCFLAWPGTLKSLLPFILPLALIKTAYLVLFLNATQAVNHHFLPWETVFALFVTAVLAAYLLGCCFFHVFYQQQGQALSTLHTLTMVQKHSKIYLMVWFLCGLLSLSGAMLFILPGIIIYIYTKYAKFIALFEPASTMQALGQSITLIAKQVWRVLAVEFFILIISFVALLITQPLTAWLTSLFHGQGTNTIGQFLTVLCIQVMVVPLIAHIQVAQYINLKQQRQIKTSSQDGQEHTTIIC